MKVLEAVRRPAVTIPADASITEAAELMASSGVGAVAVVDAGELVGIVTDRDLVCRCVARGVRPDARIDSQMSMPVHTIAADADVHDAYGMFREHPVRRLVVIDGAGVVGLITVDDLLINLSSHLADLSRPVTAEAVFGQREAHSPELRTSVR
ncbi:MAG: CBS domain-containing protein [Microthrixaceae bacterium]